MDKKTTWTVYWVVNAVSIPLFVVGFTICFVILAHYYPPPNMMAMTPEQLISEYYGKYQSQITIGQIGAALVGFLHLPWSCLLALMMRDENGRLNIFGLVALIGGGGTSAVLSFLPCMWTACAIFATSVDPSIIKFAHVTTWFLFDLSFMITTLQMGAIGAYIVLNKKQKIFPAWIGWYAIADGMIYFPLVLIPFATEGPFTVAGMWNWWFILVSWGGAFTSIWYFMQKEINTQRKSLALAS